MLLKKKMHDNDQKREMKMKKVNHEVVLFLEPSEKAYDTPSKIGYLFMNRFAIDEDAWAFNKII